MKKFIWVGLGLVVAMKAGADGIAARKLEDRLDWVKDGKVWLSTVTKPYDPNNREETYKVYTHLYDFEGAGPITKGPGGKYTHHRGLFIGWKDTLVPEGDTMVDYDTWHMDKCYQEHAAWREVSTGPSGAAIQIEEVLWKDEKGAPFIREIREIRAQEDGDDRQIFDFQSVLTSLRGTIQLRGDLQHAGMQVRMDNEVSEHEDSTLYILPEKARELEDDKVIGAWWVCCSPVVRDKRYWLIHMTPPNHPTREPVYSIRRYARFGAFFETDLKENEPLTLNFRIILSEEELDQDSCAQLYKTYAQAGK